MTRPALIDILAGGSLGAGATLAAFSLERGQLWTAAFFSLGVLALTLLVWLSR